MDLPLKAPARPIVKNDSETSWVFDLDNTLYPEECNLFAKIDLKMGDFISNLLGVDRAEARRVQKDYFVTYGTTLQGLMKVHGTDPFEFLNFVHDIDLTPVQENPGLRQKLTGLRGKKFVFTNGDVPYATRVLERLGLAGIMDGIFDIAEAGFVPKPNQAAYDSFVRHFSITPQKAVMFEDMARNLVPASRLGMTTVWVKTRYPWGTVDYAPEHIHYETQSLEAWFGSHLEDC